MRNCRKIGLAKVSQMRKPPNGRKAVLPLRPLQITAIKPDPNPSNPMKPTATKARQRVLAPTVLLTLAGFLALIALSPGDSHAGEYGKAILNDKSPVASSGWSVCDFFSPFTLYEGDGFVQRVRYRARYQGQFVNSRDDYPGGGDAEFWQHRRWRSGIDIDMANDLKFMSSFNHDTSPNFRGDRFLDSIFEMKIEWKPSDDFYLVLGKQKNNITREWATSSANILTFERSAISNNVFPLPQWGAAVGFAAGGLMHEIGLYSVAYDNGFAWPAFDNAGASLTYRTAYDLTEATSLHFDYQYTDTTTSQGFNKTYMGSPYEHVFAFGSESRWGRLGLVTDLIFGLDRRPDARAGFNGGEDTWGLVIMPYYDLTEKLQIVTKYSYAEEVRIDRPQRHASRPSVDGLSTFYVGLNYRICGDRLKLMAGYEYATADRIIGTNDRYRNDSWLFGIRANW